MRKIINLTTSVSVFIHPGHVGVRHFVVVGHFMALHCNALYFYCIAKLKSISHLSGGIAGNFPAFKHLCVIHKRGGNKTVSTLHPHSVVKVWVLSRKQLPDLT